MLFPAARAGAADPISTSTLPGAVQPGHDRAVPQAPPPEFNFRVEAPERSPIPRAVDKIRFKLNDIRITGATTIPQEQFRPLYQGLIGHEISLSDILDVADKIEAKYRAAGYLLVRAYVPPQRVRDGVFTINISEGFVSAVSVQGADDATARQIKAYLQPVLNAKPLRLAIIERALLLSNDLPGVSATGVLRPSPDTPGASELVVAVAEPQFSGGLSADNRGSRFSGVWTVTGSLAATPVFGDDQLSGDVTVAPDKFEQIAGQLRYAHAIGDDGLMGNLIGTITHGDPGSTLRAFDVLTNSWAIGPRLTYPILRSRAESLSVDGGFTVQDARVNVLGVNLSDDKWRVLDAALTYQQTNLLGGSFSGSVDLAQGLHILGATDNDSPDLSRMGAQTDFTKFSGVAHYTMPIFSPVSVAFATQAQFSLEPLITGEQVTFGGTQIGRGYDPGAITGDHGLGGSLELRYDTRFPDYAIQALQPYAFVDAAQTWYIQRGLAKDSDLTNQSIASVGAGLRFWFPHNLSADVEVARTLDPVPGSDDGKRTTKILVDAAFGF